jgi:hypothetical protein
MRKHAQHTQHPLAEIMNQNRRWRWWRYTVYTITGRQHSQHYRTSWVLGALWYIGVDSLRVRAGWSRWWVVGVDDTHRGQTADPVGRAPCSTHHTSH